VKIEISEVALGHLVELAEWWDANRPEARVRVDTAFEQVLEEIAEHPKVGAPYPGSEATLAPLPAGAAWLVLMSAAVTSNSTSLRNVRSRLMVAGEEVGLSEPVVATDRWHPWTAMRLVTDATTATDIAVQLASDQGTASIQSLRIVGVPLPSRSDIHYLPGRPTLAMTGWYFNLSMAPTPRTVLRPP